MTALEQTPASFADELQQRLVQHAVRVLRLADALPKTVAGRHIAQQIIRAGTSPAPNYAEARAAESTSEFVHDYWRICRMKHSSSVKSFMHPSPPPKSAACAAPMKNDQ